MAARERIDRILVARGLVETRSRARALIEGGKVSVHGTVVQKPAELVALDVEIQVAREQDFVSRGGHKLAGALADFQLSPRGLVIADIGASTGGFTDCVLQRGALRVYAIDVGHEQLHPTLRGDARVVNMERLNARELRPDSLPEAIDWVLVDASFIGLAKLLPALSAIVRPGGKLLALVKPQFEVGPERVGKRGVVHDDTHRQEALAAVVACANACSLLLLGSADCKLEGPEGNREIFALFERAPER